MKFRSTRKLRRHFETARADVVGGFPLKKNGVLHSRVRSIAAWYRG
jgi:hypothetical protein